ncbi:iron-sulfur cluster assembly protein [Salicibibacter cibarius]|uniref:Iron-sulfur cluster assembly protein n=1 Tax=Salicibibacter cibarius TaxID=2743000 RepID=A0A7T7CC00_9BACI|nr:iron-sulfur cluster assembly protein [Salicibibacter cibarius]QQK76487.1 iron-sulfur cluster assembly protein [Salicibibacter cibarius]
MFKTKQVYDCLELVMDPELDQSLLELDFIEDVEINENVVHVIFRLPTYWCSPNFAYIMGEDIRDEILGLKWPKHVQVTLHDHSESEKVSKGVTEGYSFEEMFPDKTDGSGLDELRSIFKRKAFYARQERLLQYLLKKGHSKDLILAITLDSLKSIDDRKLEYLYLNYLDIRKDFKLSQEENSFLITDHTGKSIEKEEFDQHLLHARRSRLTMDFNGHYCQGLLQTRYTNFAY